MADVDATFLHLQMPAKLANDPEVEPYFRALHRLLSNLYARSGGSVDTLNTVVGVVTEVPGVQPPTYDPGYGGNNDGQNAIQ